MLSKSAWNELENVNGLNNGKIIESLLCCFYLLLTNTEKNESIYSHISEAQDH